MKDINLEIRKTEDRLWELGYKINTAMAYNKWDTVAELMPEHDEMTERLSKLKSELAGPKHDVNDQSFNMNIAENPNIKKK